MAFSCGMCGAAISAGQIDFAKKMAACGACGNVAALGATVGAGPVARLPAELPWEEDISSGVATIVVKNALAHGYTQAMLAFVLALVGGCGFARFAWRPFLAVLAVAIVLGVRAYRELTASTMLRMTAKGLFARRRSSNESLHLNSAPLVFRAEGAPDDAAYVSLGGAPIVFKEDSALRHAATRTIPWWTVHVETSDGSVRSLPLRLDNAQLAEHAATRLNEVLSLLQSTVGGGYRVAPNMSDLSHEGADELESRRRDRSDS